MTTPVAAISGVRHQLDDKKMQSLCQGMPLWNGSGKACMLGRFSAVPFLAVAKISGVFRGIAKRDALLRKLLTFIALLCPKWTIFLARLLLTECNVFDP